MLNYKYITITQIYMGASPYCVWLYGTMARNPLWVTVTFRKYFTDQISDNRDRKHAETHGGYFVEQNLHFLLLLNPVVLLTEDTITWGHAIATSHTNVNQSNCFMPLFTVKVLCVHYLGRLNILFTYCNNIISFFFSV